MLSFQIIPSLHVSHLPNNLFVDDIYLIVKNKVIKVLSRFIAGIVAFMTKLTHYTNTYIKLLIFLCKGRLVELASILL